MTYGMKFRPNLRPSNSSWIETKVVLGTCKWPLISHLKVERIAQVVANRTLVSEEPGSNLVKLIRLLLPFPGQLQLRGVSHQRVLLPTHRLLGRFPVKVFPHVVAFLVRQLAFDERKDAAVDVRVLRVELADGQLVISLLEMKKFLS